MSLFLPLGRIGMLAPVGGNPTTFSSRVMATSPSVYFPLSEASSATTVADLVGGAAGTLVNKGDIEFQLPSLAEDGEASMAFSGGETDPGYITRQDFLTSTALGLAAMIQPDVVDIKHTVITSSETGGTSPAGHCSLELNPDTVGGLTVRGFSVDSTGTARVILGSAGDVGRGQTVWIAYVRLNNSSPSQIIYVNGVVRAQDTVNRGTWPAVPSSLWHIGIWPTLVSGFDGPMAHVVGWSTPPDASTIQSLALPTGFSTIADLTLDDLHADAAVDVGFTGRTERGFHTKGTITPQIQSQPTKSTVAVSGQGLRITAGAEGGADSFDYAVVDDHGLSPTETISYTILADPTPPPTPSGSGPWQGLGVGIYVVGTSYGDLAIHNSPHPTIKFVCERTGTVAGVRYHHRVNQSGQSGYSEGNGGIIRAKLHEDSSGAPGAVLAQTATFSPNLGSQAVGPNVAGKLLTLTTNPVINAGTVYHWRWYNEHGSPGSNYSSINSLANIQHDFNNNNPGNQNIGMCPVFGNKHWLMRGTTFNWKYPLYATVYADGTQVGQQVATNRREDRALIGGSNRARVRMTPLTQRTVRWVYVCLFKTGSTNQTTIPLSVQVKNSNGSVLATATIPATAVGYDPDISSQANRINNEFDPQTDSGAFRQAPWCKGLLSQQLTLTADTSYFVELSAASGANYNLYSLQVLGTGQYNDLRYQEARGQFSTNGGSSWTNALDTGTPATSSVYPVLLHFNDTNGTPTF